MPTPPFGRRTLLKGAGGALVVTGLSARGAQAAAPAGAVGALTQTASASEVFRHGVASGDPLGTAVVLWTRVTPTPEATPGSGKGMDTQVTWELADDPAFIQIRKTGTVRTSADRDHTVHVDVTGLTPYTRYFYRFRALGLTSPAGRTQTAADDGRLHALRLAFVSCSNYTGGYFTPYRYVAERDDLDLVLHLGDYVYEYGNGDDRYGPAGLAGKRDHQPPTEMITLPDYRQRHAQYKTDPDLQAAHAAHPWIVILDDHEVADNTYDTGAVNHQPDTEGEFLVRRARAYQAYLEWMPIRLPDQSGAAGVRFWRRFSFGPLADLSIIETRQNRSKQVEGAAGALAATDVAALTSPDRVLLEPAQLAWLTDGIRSKATRWHLIGNQTVFTRVALAKSIPGQDQLGPLGLGDPAFNADQWDGYQDDQREVLTAMSEAGGDPVVLTGDIHSSWANDLPLDPGTYVPVGPANNSVGVEFVCPSVTSDGFTEIFGSEQAAQAATTGLMTNNPNIRYLDGIGHGFCVLDVTPERVQTDFFFVSDREDPDATMSFAAAFASVRGSRQISAADAQVGPRSDRPRTASAAATGSPTAPSPSAAAGSATAGSAAAGSGSAGQPGRVSSGGRLPATGLPAGTAVLAVGAVVAGGVAVRANRLADGGESVPEPDAG